MTEKTRILFLTQYHSIGGLERVVLNLCRALNAMPEFQPLMMSYDRIPGVPTLETAFHEAGIPFQAFTKPPGFSISALMRIASHVRKEKVDIIHTHDLGPLIYGALVKVLSGGKVRLIHTQHGFSDLGLRRRDRFYNRVFAALADRICAVSTAVRTTYEDLGVPRGKVHEIRNGMEFPREPLLDLMQLKIHRKQLLKTLTPELRAEMLPRLEDYWILSLGRIHPGKGQDHVLKIWNELSPLSRSKSVLLLVGPETASGTLDRLRALPIECRERVFFVGNAPTPMSWYQTSDLYISASEYEGLPLAPVEAAGAGLPVILSDIPGHQMLRSFGRLFSLTRPQDAAALVEDAIRSHPHNRQRQWIHTQALRNELSVDSMARQYLGVYEMRPTG